MRGPVSERSTASERFGGPEPPSTAGGARWVSALRWVAAGWLLIATGDLADAKILCPPGRFVLQTTGASPVASALSGRELELGVGKASIAGSCPQVAAAGHGPMGNWLSRIRASWRRCGDGRPLSLRARWDLDAPYSYCTRLEGTLRRGRGRRGAFVATRIRECGNGVREPGEECDGDQSPACCTPDCRVVPGCPLRCDLVSFPCAIDQICVHTCGNGNYCWPRARVDCTSGPVCSCNEEITYASACAAYEAGKGVRHPGPCRRSCSRAGADCGADSFCDGFGDPGTCYFWRTGSGRGLCSTIPPSCAGTPDAPACGCDGTTYRNDCERLRAQMAGDHAGPCPLRPAGR